MRIIKSKNIPVGYVIVHYKQGNRTVQKKVTEDEVLHLLHQQPVKVTKIVRHQD